METATYYPDRDRLLNLSEEQLVLECRCDRMRGTGPGGQKRNKTESAVRVMHEKTGLYAFDDEQRSQHLNRHRALQKLRLELALHLRCEPRPWTQTVPGVHSEQYVFWAAVALDALTAVNFSMADAGKCLGTTTNQLVKNLSRMPAVWQFVNQERQKRNLSILKN